MELPVSMVTFDEGLGITTNYFIVAITYSVKHCEMAIFTCILRGINIEAEETA